MFPNEKRELSADCTKDRRADCTKKRAAEKAGLAAENGSPPACRPAENSCFLFGNMALQPIRPSV